MTCTSAAGSELNQIPLKNQNLALANETEQNSDTQQPIQLYMEKRY